MKAYQSFLYNLGVASGDVESIDWKTFMLVPSAGRTVETIAAQGTVLGENPLLTTRNGSPTIVARATIDVTRDLHVGSTAEAKSTGGPQERQPLPQYQSLTPPAIYQVKT